MKLCWGSLTLWERANTLPNVPFSLYQRNIISFSWSPQPWPSKAQQPTVIRHVINHTLGSYTPWNLRFNASWQMRRMCQLAVAQTYLVLQYDFPLPLNLHLYWNRRVPKMQHQLLAGQQVREELWWADLYERDREGPKKLCACVHTFFSY